MCVVRTETLNLIFFRHHHVQKATKLASVGGHLPKFHHTNRWPFHVFRLRLTASFRWLCPRPHSSTRPLSALACRNIGWITSYLSCNRSCRHNHIVPRARAISELSQGNS